MTSDDELDELMGRLRRSADQVGPVPDGVVDAARAAFLSRRLDEELAELVFDSAQTAGVVRGPGETVRLLSFEGGGVSVEVQVEQSGARVTIRGVVTGATGQAVLETSARQHSTAIDDEGWFVVPGVAAGPARIRLTATDGTAVVTPWVAA